MYHSAQLKRTADFLKHEIAVSEEQNPKRLLEDQG